MKSFNIFSRFAITALAVAVLSCSAAIITLCINGPNPDILVQKEKEEIISSAQLEKTFDYGNNYIKSIVFVGDRSISSLPSIYNELDKSQVWSGIGGNLPLDYNLATTAIIHSDDPKGTSIANAAALYKPQYIVITVGIENGVGHCSEDKFKEYYSRLIESIRDSAPDTKIILQSILPVSKEAEKADPSISNDRIDDANRYVASLAEELSLRYLNTASVLKNEDGYLDKKYDSGDGIVLNKDGYDVVIDYIRTHGYK